MSKWIDVTRLNCSNEGKYPYAANDFAGRLREARISWGLNQTEFAEKAGLQPSAIGHFESGRRKPKLANIVKLARACHVSSDYLLGLTNQMTGKTGTVFDEILLLPIDQRRTFFKMARMMLVNNKEASDND